MAKQHPHRVNVEGTDFEAELDRSDGIVCIYLNGNRVAQGEGVERALDLARSYLATRYQQLNALDPDRLHGFMWQAAAKPHNPPDLSNGPGPVVDPTAPGIPAERYTEAADLRPVASGVRVGLRDV